MSARDGNGIGLLIRSGPFTGRSARDQLDLALTAATLDFELNLFFTGAGIQQLLPDHDPHGAGLPRGSKGWASLPALTRVRAWVSAESLQGLGATPAELLLDVQPLTRAEMALLLAACRRVLVV